MVYWMRSSFASEVTRGEAVHFRENLIKPKLQIIPKCKTGAYFITRIITRGKILQNC